MLNILILDKSSLSREGLSLVVNELSDCEVVGVSSDCDSLEKLISFEKEYILLLRLSNFPDHELSICAYIKEAYPGVKILLISKKYEKALIVSAFEHGASGFYKDSYGTKKLHKAFHLISQGGYFFEALNGDFHKSQINNRRVIPLANFSDRELEIMEMVLLEKTNRQIAEKLEISERTVESHRSNIINKSDCKNMIGVVIYMLKRGQKILDHSEIIHF